MLVVVTMKMLVVAMKEAVQITDLIPTIYESNPFCLRPFPIQIFSSGYLTNLYNCPCIFSIKRIGFMFKAISI